MCCELSGSVIITSLQSIVKNEGFRGMYRGLSPTIIALLPNWAVSTPFLSAESCFVTYLLVVDVLVSNVGVLLSVWKAKGCPAVKWLVTKILLCSYVLQS